MEQSKRKVIHIDMDAFYASIEERDAPELKGKPLAVGGSSGRGVLTTANYEARKFGCRSAMPVFKAKELCPHLTIVPCRFAVYREDSTKIRSIFARFTELIEPLSLDEAYLDVSHLSSSGPAIAREIRKQIFEETQLTASAGIAPNKMLAKIASDWKKPNDQFHIREEDVYSFMQKLPVSKLWGVGKKAQVSLKKMNIQTCGELQNIDRFDLAKRFGQWGLVLYHLARGEDQRLVSAERERKSISSEHTFAENVSQLPVLEEKMKLMLDELQHDVHSKYSKRRIRSLVVKIKFADFQRTTAESASEHFDQSIFQSLLKETWKRKDGRDVRLLGVGVRFHDTTLAEQMKLF